MGAMEGAVAGANLQATREAAARIRKVEANLGVLVEETRNTNALLRELIATIRGGQ